MRARVSFSLCAVIFSVLSLICTAVIWLSRIDLHFVFNIPLIRKKMKEAQEKARKVSCLHRASLCCFESNFEPSVERYLRVLLVVLA